MFSRIGCIKCGHSSRREISSKWQSLVLMVHGSAGEVYDKAEGPLVIVEVENKSCLNEFCRIGMFVAEWCQLLILRLQ
jgi:hypothetical protein